MHTPQSTTSSVHDSSRRAQSIPDQRLHWERWHLEHEHASPPHHTDSLRDQFLSALRSDCRPDLRASASSRSECVLEIGCGQGRDAIALAEAGVEVTAIDHSRVAIARASATASPDLPITWEVGDYADRLRTYASAAFDGVYSHLSLHYLNDEATVELFDHIARVLRPAGLMLFTVRTDDDPLYGLGHRIGPDVYVHEGHVRHFFSVAYTQRLLSRWKEVDVHHYATEHPTPNPGAFIRVRARRARLSR